MGTHCWQDDDSRVGVSHSLIGTDPQPDPSWPLKRIRRNRHPHLGGERRLGGNLIDLSDLHLPALGCDGLEGHSGQITGKGKTTIEYLPDRGRRGKVQVNRRSQRQPAILPHCCTGEHGVDARCFRGPHLRVGDPGCHLA